MITVDPVKFAAIRNEKARVARQKDFKTELDPLTMKCVRGEATQAEVEAKAAEIRARHPYE